MTRTPPPSAPTSQPCTSPVPPHQTFRRYGAILHSLPGPEQRKIHALIESFEELFPREIREDRWYLSAVGALTGTSHPTYISNLYLYLCEKPQYQTPLQRQHLARRLREALIKCIIINGIPVVLEAFRALAAVEQAEDCDRSTTRVGWQVSEAATLHGRETLRRLYKGEEGDIYASLGSHKEDVAWISDNISYGLFLAPHDTLSIEDSELVILPAVLGTGLRGPGYWHLRASLRLGFSVEQVESVHRILDVLGGWKVGGEACKRGERGPRAGDVVDV